MRDYTARFKQPFRNHKKKITPETGRFLLGNPFDPERAVMMAIFFMSCLRMAFYSR